LTFLIIWVLLFVSVTAWTMLTAPTLLKNPVFWMGNATKLGIMCAVSLIGGAMCRWFCKTDEDGYILTSKASWFKVNYTRKFQHFAAYAVPLLVHFKHEASIPGSAILHLAWGDVFTLLGFLVLIKPVREMKWIGTPFMMMFNSLDRPEDRPDCLKWIIGGNILPGLFIIIGFHLLYGYSFEPLQAQLVMIFVLVAGVGDGFAEPVGIYFGTHKYKTRSCTSADLYTRSLEGSACVFLTTFIWLIMYAQCFPHESQFWILMVVLPPVMTLAEATSPHTMDTPIIMILGGLLIYLDLRFTTCYAGNHGGLFC
jgi:dolichol kinase